MTLLRDIVRSLKSWRRTPAPALLGVLTLGLSGGALLTLVSLFNALFWRELPVSHPEELVAVYGADERAWGPENPTVPVGVFDALGRAVNVFQSVGGFERLDSTAVINNMTGRVAIEGVSGRYFGTLGVRPGFGQVISERDVEDSAQVATISFHCWQTRFEADPDVVGRTFRVQGELLTVIGVAPRAFTGLEVGVPADAWVPQPLIPRLRNQPPNLSFLTAFGRLRPDVTLPQARAQIETLWPQARDAAIATSPPDWRNGLLALQPRVESAARGFSGSGYRFFYRRPLALLVLFSAVTIVLACANLSGLLLGRWSKREGDLAVQAALGASNGRLVSQVVGESLALSVVAALLSAPVALWSAKSLTVLLWNRPDLSSPLDLSPDYRVLGVMVGLMGLVAVCVSILPASRILSAKLTLLGGTGGLPGPSVTRWGRWLATAQVALSVPLLVTAWTVAANLHRLAGVNTGFRPDEVIVASLINGRGVAPVADPVAYLRQLTADLRANPGIEAAAFSWSEPASFSDDRRRRRITTDDGVRGASPFVAVVSPDYFETLSVPFVAGRDFRWTDDSGRPDAAIISGELARALFSDAKALGRRVRLSGPPDRVLEVIGVVADAKLAEAHATNHWILFTALGQEPRRSLETRSPLLLLKSPLPPRAVEALARPTTVALGRHDVLDVHPLQRTLDAALLRERVMRLGASYFAGLTTLLVFVGLYAVLSLGVTRRIPEIGLRLALGASGRDIRLTVVREAFLTAATGVVVGVPLAFVSGRLIVNSLTLEGSHDPVAFGAAVALILAVSAFSVLIPVRRASRVTPLEALAGR